MLKRLYTRRMCHRFTVIYDLRDLTALFMRNKIYLRGYLRNNDKILVSEEEFKWHQKLGIKEETFKIHTE